MSARRTPFAFDLAALRVAEYTARAARWRMATALLAAVVLGLVGGPIWAWALLALAILGAYQALALSHAVLANRTPREPLARWAYNSAVEGHGRHWVNVSGVIEGVSAISFAVISAWGISEFEARLAMLGLAVIWAVSVFTAVFVDPAFYQPDPRPPAALEALRVVGGPLLAGLAMAIAYSAAWPAQFGAAPALIALGACVLSVRVAETDRLFRDAETQGEVQELRGRDLVLGQMHSSLSGPVQVSLLLAEQYRAVDPAIYEQARIVRSRMHELTSLEDPSVTDAELPGSLERAVAGVARPWGTRSRTHIHVTRLAGADHNISRLLIGDLVSNAAKAGAQVVTVSLRRDQETLEMTVEDDVGDFPPSAWRQPGSSLDRLGRILEARAGTLTLQTAVGRTKVRGRWRETPTDSKGDAQ
jgi:hypothetical protein